MASLDDHQKANGARLSRLLIDKGTEAMRKVFDNIHHPSTLAAVLNSYRGFLQKLRCINCSQMDILFPPSGSNAVSEDFDITLLFVLLRNICGLHPPASTGSWDKNPPLTDTSKEANLARIKYYRNVVYGHITSTGINDTDFHLYWNDISSALLCLGVCRGEIELLRRAPLDVNCYLNLIREWKSKEDKLEIILHDQSDALAKLGNVPERLEKVEEALKELNLKEAKNVGRLENLKGIQDQQDVTSQLAKCSFKGDIKRSCKSFHEGTRSWLLRKLNQWFTDVESDTTVMTLIAGPGIGKSVFAAKVCKVYEEMGQLAACHFCKFNFSDCRNPQIMLESLSSHMCQSVPGFKEKLTEQLLRRHSRDSIADTFRVLLNDPLHSLEEREPMMIVIDGLDEVETSGKSELLDLIAREFSKLPMWIKIFITSRPELPIRQKLNHVSNLEIQATNDNNNEDVKHFLASRLADYEVSENIFDILVKRCEGSFLFAYHILNAISLRYEHTGFKSSDIESCVPKSIGSVYEEYFHRLKHEIEKLRNGNSSEVNFIRILEIMAAGLGPIPLDFVARVLELPADTRAMRRVIREVNERLSALLLVSDDCITIFHQTVVDWLLSKEYDEHLYTVEFKPGHKHLWQVCRSEFENLESIRWDRRRGKTRKYAAKYGLEHLKLQTNPDVRGATPGFVTPFSDCISVISMHLEEDEEMMYGYGWLLCRGNNHAYVMTTCHLLSEIERDELKTLESKQRVYFPSSRSNENENYLDITNNSAVVSSDEDSCLDYAVIRLRTSDKVCLEKPLTIARQCLSTGSSITPAGLMYEIHPGDVLPYPTDLVDWLKCATRFGSRGDISGIPVLTCDPNVIYDWDEVEMNDCLFAYNAGIHNRRFSGCPLVDASDKVVGMHSFSVYIEECRDDKYVVSFGVRMEKIIEDINRKNPTLAKKCFSNSA